MSAGPRSWSSEERRLARAGGGWWSLAQNPPCLPWCTVEHDADDFRVLGALLCIRPVSERVAIEREQTASEDVLFGLDLEENVRVVVVEDLRDAVMGAREAVALARELEQAARLAERHRRDEAPR